MAITFTDPLYLWLFLIIPFFIVTHFYSLKYVKKRAIRLANFEAIKRVSGAEKVSINLIILFLRLFILSFLILSLSGMILWYEGISSDNSYVLAIDASGSMLADDFKPNRLEAAKSAAILFVNNLDVNVEVGIVSFAGVAEIEKELTTDLYEARDSIILTEFKSIHGTAIGDAIKISHSLLSGSEKSRVIILLTDGRENIVSRDELFRIIQLAKDNQETIHTIGIGTEGGGSIPGIDMTSTIDEDILKRIATITNGKYYMVESEEKLKEAYMNIATSSHSEIPIKMRIPLIISALILIFIEWGLLNTKFKSIP